MMKVIQDVIQGVIQKKTCNKIFITYLQQKAVTYMQLSTFIDNDVLKQISPFNAKINNTDTIKLHVQHTVQKCYNIYKYFLEYLLKYTAP